MRGEVAYAVFTAVGIVWVLACLSPRWRKLVLLASAVVLGFLHLELPSVHCIVEGFFAFLGGPFLGPGMIWKLALAFVPAVFVGRVFCGYVCPKGAAQELLFVRRLRLRVPRRLDRILRLLPYPSLAALVAFPLAWHYRFWTDLDPFLWLFHGRGHLPGLLLLVALIPASVVLSRPFCRYLCPLVPIFRLLSRLAPVARSTDPDRCVPCRKGLRSCDFDVVDAPRRFGGAPAAAGPEGCRFHRQECLQCNRCRTTCPEQAIR